MQIIYFPGMSQKNRDELEHFVSTFSGYNIPLQSQAYKHWDEESVEFDFIHELESCKKILESNKKEDTNLICKSIGTTLGAKAIEDSKILIRRLVLMGIPSDFLRQYFDSYKSALRQSTQVLIILNEKDPYVDKTKVNELTEGLENVVVNIIPQVDTHKYYYAKEVIKFLNS